MYFSKGSDLQVFKLLFFHSDAGAKENQISRVKVLWIYMPLEVLQCVVSECEKRLRVSEQALPSSSPGGVTPRERTGKGREGRRRAEKGVASGVAGPLPLPPPALPAPPSTSHSFATGLPTTGYFSALPSRDQTRPPDCRQAGKLQKHSY